MKESSMASAVAFPREFPHATIGIPILEQNILITGHKNGYVVKWDLATGNYDILYKCNSRIETVSKSASNEIAVGCNSGLLFTFKLGEHDKRNIIQEATHSKSARIWRSTWLSDNTLLTSSTYGVLNAYERYGTTWRITSLSGHSDSVFGLDGTLDSLIATGDWTGKIIIREFIEGHYLDIQKVKVAAAVEGIAWHKDLSFATVDQLGHINFFEQNPEGGGWRLALETDTASSQGNCVMLTSDGRTVFAGTNTEIIQFDIDTQLVQLIPSTNVRAIFARGNEIFALTESGLYQFERTKVVVPEESVKYQYSKVSLIGHTGAGKTTLCSQITAGSSENIESTYGKRIWNWILPPEEGKPERRVVFHDHGGQETVLDTFLPFLADSDVILIFYKKTDQTTFEKAVKIRNELDELITNNTKIYFVETFIDQKMDTIDRARLNALIDSGRIADSIQVSPATNRGVEDFKEKLRNTIDWSTVRTMIRSEHVESLERSISALFATNATVMTFSAFKQFHENNSKHAITSSHLKFLLQNFSSQGIIEYYPDVINSIIFNDEKYNELRTNIPLAVEQKKGVISIREIENRFKLVDYIKMIDQVYLAYGVAIENGDLRIFPNKLTDSIAAIPMPYKEFLSKPAYRHSIFYAYQAVKGGRVLKALSELGLQFMDASTNEGLFAWERNACIYYKHDKFGDPINGYFLKFAFTIGGEKTSITSRLDEEFQAIIDRLFGPRLAVPKTAQELS
jgi:GTPase SAR1 family protein